MGRAKKKNWCFGFPEDSGWPGFSGTASLGAELRVRREEVSLYELPDASPIGLRSGPSAQAPLPIVFHKPAPRWNRRCLACGTSVVNIALRPWLRAASGRQPLESIGRRVGADGGPCTRRRDAL